MRSFRLSLAATTVALFAIVPSVPAFAWWDIGHEAITQGALTHLPAQLAALLNPNAALIVQTSGIEPPSTHYINWETYPGFSNTPAFFNAFPHTFNAAVAKYGSATVTNNGMGPWQAESYLANLTSLMQNAHTQQDWANLVPTAAALAHYIEDLHQPLHLTANFDGASSGNSGIHARYEGEMVTRDLIQLAVSPNPAACVYYTSFDNALFADMVTGYQYVDDVLAADTAAHNSAHSTSSTAYYDALWASTGNFTKTQFQTASEMVASAWYTAWINAGSPAITPEPASLCILSLGVFALLKRRSRT